MRNKRKSWKLIIAGAVVCGFSFAQAQASTVWSVSGVLVNDPLPVLMVDGADKNTDVRINIQLESLRRSSFDFGFVKDGSYIPIASHMRVHESYKFIAGDVVDFAIRNWGSDHVFGTTDDLVYRLSDSAGYARQYYFGLVGSAGSRDSKAAQSDYRELRIDWDVDRDGKADVETWIGVKRHGHDGITPAAAPVPVPSAMWLFGSGLLSLAAALRCRRDFRA